MVEQLSLRGWPRSAQYDDLTQKGKGKMSRAQVGRIVHGTSNNNQHVESTEGDRASKPRTRRLRARHALQQAKCAQ